MYTNSHLYNVIACLKFFHKARKTIFYYPEASTYTIEFLNLLWRSGVLGGYTSGKSRFLHTLKFSHTDKFNFWNRRMLQHSKLFNFSNGMLIQIRSPRYRVDSVSFEIISKSACPKYTTFKIISKYQNKRNTQSTLYLNSIYGFISSDEVFSFNFRIGGIFVGRSF